MEAPFHRCQKIIAIYHSSPDGSRGDPEGLALLLVDAGGDLGAHEHEVGARVDDVGDEVAVLGLDLLRVLEDVLGVLLPHAAVHVVHLHLLQLLEGLELDQQHDRVDLVLVQPLHVLQVDGEHAVLVLLVAKKTFCTRWECCNSLTRTYPIADISDGFHCRALVIRSSPLEFNHTVL